MISERTAWAAAVLLLAALAGAQQLRISTARADLAEHIAQAERDRAAGARAIAEQQRRHRDTERRAAEALQEIDHAHHQAEAALRADRDRAAAAAVRLRDQLAALRPVAGPASAAGLAHPAAGSPPAGPAAGVLAELLGRCSEQLRAVAEHADAARAAGQRCERGWDAVSEAQPAR